jgi:DNA (cytosine-5)-methyltransferase 1
VTLDRGRHRRVFENAAPMTAFRNSDRRIELTSLRRELLERTRESRGRRSKDLRIVAVDLFCGAGGLSLGLCWAGMEVALGIDADPKCQHAYREGTGAKFLVADVTDLDNVAPKIVEAWGDADVRVLAGCAPCQPFSTYTQARAHWSDPRWALLGSFYDLIERTEPDIVTMENVPGLAKMEIFHDFIEGLEGAQPGYLASAGVLDCRLYGVPQTRRRLVSIASSLGRRPSLPSPTHEGEGDWTTVAETIGQLPPINHGGSHPSDPIHASSYLSPVNLRRIQHSVPGGTWRDWPEHLVADCHKRTSGRSYPGVYGRMSWDQPAPTLTGQCYGYGNGRFGHPAQDRAISLREASLLQSFPPDYPFVAPGEKVRKKSIGLMIGNAVPPRLAKAVGTTILRHVVQVSLHGRLPRRPSFRDPHVTPS